MAGKQVHTYPTDEEFVELGGRLGSVSAIARHVNIPEPTLSGWLQKNPAVKRKVDFAIKKHHRRTRTPIPKDGRVTEAEVLRSRNVELESELRRLRGTQVEEERQLRRFDDALSAVRPHVFAAPKPRSGKQAPHEMALLLSDLHAFEVVDPESVMGMNQYNRAVLIRRLERLRDRVLSYVEHRPYPVKKLHIWMLGDMLSGDIHEELAMTNELPHEESVVQLAYDLAPWLESFTPYFEHISIAGVAGNHPRRAKKPASKLATNNSDWTLYKFIESYHRGNKAFDFQIPRSHFAVVTAAQRWRVLLTHGDGIRSTMPGVPWGGVVRRITTLEQQFASAKQPIDYVCMGHFHTRTQIEGVRAETFINGSVKGLDEYGLKNFGSGRRPTQTLLTFHEHRGQTDASKIDLEDWEPASA